MQSMTILIQYMMKSLILFDQAALNDLIRDLGSRLKERNLLASGTTFSWYRHRKQSLIKFFSEGENNKNSRIYGCSNKAKNRVFCTFRLELLKKLTRQINSDPGFGFYAKNYFGNDLQLFQNKTMQTCVIVYPFSSKAFEWKNIRFK